MLPIPTSSNCCANSMVRPRYPRVPAKLVRQLAVVLRGLLPFIVLKIVDLRSQEVHQEEIALDGLSLPTPLHQDVLHAHLGAGGGKHAGVVRGPGVGINVYVTPLGQGIADAELHVTGLVPTEGQTGQVIPLDEDAGAAQRLAQPGAFLKRGRGHC